MIVKYISEFIQNILNISDLNYIRIYFILIFLYFVLLYFHFENFILFYIVELFTFYNELNKITTISIYNFNEDSINIVTFVELNNLIKYINSNRNILRININLKERNSKILNIFKNIKYVKDLYIFNHINNNNIFRNFNKILLLTNFLLIYINLIF